MRLLIQAPTSAGKNYFAQLVAKHYSDQGLKVLMMVDRIELVNDLTKSRDELNLSHTIMTSQTIGRRKIANDYDVVIIDEAHVKPNSVMKQIIESKTNIIIGLTATALSKGLGIIYGKWAYVPLSFQDMVNSGIAIAPTFIASDTLIDTSKLKTGKNGEYELGDVVLDRTILNCIDEVIDKHLVLGQQCMILAPNQKEAMNIRDKLKRQSAIYVSDDKAMFQEFKDKKVEVVITVYALSKGFNHPNISLIIDCRPLRKSIIEYVQGIGRGTRTMDGKTEFKYIDMCGNYYRFEKQYIKWRISKVVKLDTKSKCCVNCDHDYLKTSLPAKCTEGEHLTYFEMKCEDKDCFVDFITENDLTCPNCGKDLQHKCLKCDAQVNICNRVCPKCFAADFKIRKEVAKKTGLMVQYKEATVDDFKKIQASFVEVDKMTEAELAWSCLRTSYYLAGIKGKSIAKTAPMYAWSLITSFEQWKHKTAQDLYRTFAHNAEHIKIGGYNVYLLQRLRNILRGYYGKRHTT